ncbi:hypothetical protein NST23_06905 [Brevibacillus sp. FSL K6-0770]|uniref:hypothetical protein n=1 Tax=Brevibacillus sp. FSL K6-0770 TaxID=2954673 RepID=UPI0030F5AC6E
MMYITCRLSATEYKTCRERLNQYLDKNFHSHKLRKDRFDKTALVTNGLAKWGFQEIRLRKGCWANTMEIRFRPQLLINQQGYYQLTSIRQFEQIHILFNYLLLDLLSLPVPDFFAWTAKRVEAAVDLAVDEQLIPKYIVLFKKGYIPEYFWMAKLTRTYWDSVTNVYLMSANKTVNWYNRYATLQEKTKKSNKQYMDFSETRGILRFETQVRDNMKSVMDTLNQTYLKQEVMKFYNLIVGKGDYYSLEKALTIVRQNTSNQTKRMALERLLRLLERCGSIHAAKDCFLEGQNADKAADKFSKRINQLRNLGINPVLLPPEWGIEWLENLYDKINATADKEEKGAKSLRELGVLTMSV